MAEPGAPSGPGPAPSEVPPEQQPDLYGELYYQSCLTLPTDGAGAAPAPYRWGEPVWEGFFGRLAEEVVARFHPRTVLDPGCAIGFLVKALRDRGVEAEGFDSSAWAISHVPEGARPFCRVGSVTDELLRDYDLITCIEVLEHVSPKEAAAAVANLCRHGRAVLFSSTPAHVEEATHLNVRPPDYWAGLFAGHGFYRDSDFDASFVAPRAVLFHPVQHWEQVVRGYERGIWNSQQELRGLRARRDHLSAELQRLLADEDRAQPQHQDLPAYGWDPLPVVQDGWEQGGHPQVLAGAGGRTTHLPGLGPGIRFSGRGGSPEAQGDDRGAGVATNLLSPDAGLQSHRAPPPRGDRVGSLPDVSRLGAVHRRRRFDSGPCAAGAGGVPATGPPHSGDLPSHQRAHRGGLQ